MKQKIIAVLDGLNSWILTTGILVAVVIAIGAGLWMVDEERWKDANYD
ncbi:MAG: hypothetical protein KGI54_15100 [Pseudomonadota bacterium]|nr:hypothetical protein [Pseudomonadota bacterium]